MKGLEDFKGLMETAQKVQAELARVKEGLSAKTTTAESGGGMVKCTANGKGEIVDLRIDRELLGVSGDEGRKMLEDLVVGAVNLALDRARELAEQEMSSVARGLALPPGMLGG